MDRPTPPEPGLSEEELGLVLRRASELGVASTPTGTEIAPVPLAAVEQAAAEVGIEPAAVRRAVAELRAGMLGGSGGVEHVPAGPVVGASRSVSMPLAEVDAVLRRWLGDQSFGAVRDQGHAQRWQRRDDVASTVRRALAKRQVSVDDAEVVVVRLAEVDGATVVRIDADLGAGTANTPRTVAGIAGVGTAAASATASGMLLDPLTAVVGLPLGLVAGWAGHRAGHRQVEGLRARTLDGIEGFLDTLERGTPPQRTPADAVRQVLDMARRPTRLRRPPL